MVPEGFQALSERRAARAALLVERHPETAEVLRFYEATLGFQQEVHAAISEAGISDASSLVRFRQPLVEFVGARGPEALRQAAAELDDRALGTALDAYGDHRDTGSPNSFFARVLLQPFTASDGFRPGPVGQDCPRCGHRGQVGVLRPQAHGSALSLLCSLCPTEWSVTSGRCVSCGEESPDAYGYFTAPDFEYLRVQACRSCRMYHHTVDLCAEPGAVPEVDELIAMPLDVWAREQGYEKLQPNLAGI